MQRTLPTGRVSAFWYHQAMGAAPGIVETKVHRVENCVHGPETIDSMAIEEPLEIRLGFEEDRKTTHKSISITMRTPGEDGELAAGFLFTEGIIRTSDQIKQIRHCGLSIGRGKGAIARAKD